MKHYEIDEEADEWMNAPMGSYQPNDELTHLRAENKQLKKKMEELALLASMSRVAYENGLINGLKGLNPGVVNMKDMDDYFNAWEESMKKEKHNMGFYVLIFLVSCIVAYKLANRKSSKK